MLAKLYLIFISRPEKIGQTDPGLGQEAWVSGKEHTVLKVLTALRTLMLTA
jgi:hypothetical protein